MFSFIGLALVCLALAAWIAVSVGYAVRRYGKGYGPRSFFDLKGLGTPSEH